MDIEEGRLDVRTCPHCGGVERRAFGEAVSERGELASYAIGWTTGNEHDTARMTVGIGAGNPGGGSFHMEMHQTDDAWGFTLVDEPFEDVPQGGPDLTADEARAHQDIRFIWWVADTVVLKDRRAWWLVAWLQRTGAYVTEPVLQETAPVLSVVRDDDGEWQLLCGTVEPDDLRWEHLHHAVDHDPTLIDVLDLEPAHRADRDVQGGPWRRGPA